MSILGSNAAFRRFLEGFKETEGGLAGDMEHSDVVEWALTRTVEGEICGCFSYPSRRGPENTAGNTLLKGLWPFTGKSWGLMALIRFCLFTSPRSGSTWIRQMIDSHPQISMFGELFWSCGRNVDDEDESKESGGFSLRPFSTFSYLDKETRELPKDAEAVGFKLMYGQLLRRPELLIKMAAQRYKLIHLVRRNAVDVIISRTLAEETGRYHSEGNVDVPRIEISPREFLGLLRKRERYLSIARNLMRCMPNKVISVFYEDVRENPKKEMHRITSFIYPECRRDGFEFSSTLKKVNRRSADEVLNNYNDIQKFMQNTEFVDLFS